MADEAAYVVVPAKVTEIGYDPTLRGAFRDTVATPNEGSAGLAGPGMAEMELRGPQ